MNLISVTLKAGFSSEYKLTTKDRWTPPKRAPLPKEDPRLVLVGDPQPQTGGDPSQKRPPEGNTTKVIPFKVIPPPEVSPDDVALSIYECYPKKASRIDAIKAIRKAMKSFDPAKLKERTIAFAQSVKGCDFQFVPYPATWFNRGGFEDDPRMWKLIGRESPKYQNGHQPKAPGGANF
jgi:hypothetical protein